MDKQKNMILKAALAEFGFDGWSAALLSAARKRKINPSQLKKLFPGGHDDLLEYFFSWVDDSMMEKLNKTTARNMRIRDRVMAGVAARIDVLSSHKDAAVAALQQQAHLKNAGTVAQRLWTTSDRIWTWAGDTSDDYNRYTKRALLSGVITATTLFWINDDSKDHAATRGFLARRIDNVVSIGQTISKIFKSA